MYSPLLARFLSPDSLVPRPEDPQSLNRYAYVLHNPLRYTDPTGHAEKDPFKRFLCDWAPQLCQPSAPPLLNEQQTGQALSAQQAPVMLNNGAQVTLFAAKREGKDEGKGGGLIGSLLRLLGGGGAGKAAQELSKDGDPTNEAALGFGALSRAAQYGIRSYNELRRELGGTGLKAHHIIEKRFAALLNVKQGDMLSVAVTKSEHAMFTRAWRTYIGYITDRRKPTTADALVNDLWDAAQKIYADYPALLDAARKQLGK